jgi:hypothetical protein
VQRELTFDSARKNKECATEGEGSEGAGRQNDRWSAKQRDGRRPKRRVLDARAKERKNTIEGK